MSNPSARLSQAVYVLLIMFAAGNPAEKMQQWSKKLNYDPFTDESCEPSDTASRPESPEADQPAAAAAAPSSSKPRRKAGKLDVAASEAAWDAVAARTSADGSSSSSSEVPASIKKVSNMHVHVNGKSHAAAANGNGSSSKSAALSSKQQQQQQQQQGAAAAAGSGEDAQQQHWNPEEAKQYMYEQVTGHQHLQSSQEHGHEQQQQQQPVAPAAAAAAAPAAAAGGQLASAAERLKAAGAIGGVHGVSASAWRCAAYSLAAQQRHHAGNVMCLAHQWLLRHDWSLPACRNSSCR
jgi:hypothetical protein